jgi:nitroreductase
VLPGDTDSIELTRLSSSLTSVGLDDGFTWLEVPPAPRPQPALGLPRRVPSERDLFEVIRERRSYREFAAREVSQEAFATVLASAALPFGWLRSAPLVELFVVVRAVAGVEPGTYRYDSERHALSSPIRRGALQIEEAGLDQAVLGRAAFVLAWALLEERVGKSEGARDFRHACLEAGVSGEAAYLAATAGELGICGVGAFYDEEVNALFASTAGSPRVIYLAGVGSRSE